MKIEICRKEFIDFIQFEKRASNNTLLAYSNDLFQFVNYLDTVYEIKSITEVGHTIIRSWVVSLVEQKISSRSINRKITTLKSFYKFLIRQNIILEDPMLKILSPKVPKRLPSFIEKDKMDTLLDDTFFGDDFEGIRNKLIIEVFYATGIRLSELINLKQSNVDLYLCQIKVLGKRNKERIIPFNTILKEQIQQYIILKADVKSEFFFINKNGKKLYEKFIYRLVKTYLSQITSAKKKSPHVLRHSFATHMLNNGADLNAIKELLGHTSLAATQIYTHNTVEKLKSIHKQAHPKG